MRLSSKGLILLALFCCSTAYSATKSLSSRCETWFPAKGKRAVGVVVVTHGLNLSPAKMDDLARLFSEKSFEVLRPSFSGHCGKEEELQNIRPELWESDARRFHALAKAKADFLRVPLYLVAYSFSGLIYQSMSAELPFAKRIYFAPALETHFWYPISVFLINLWPVNFFRTMIPEGYFAHEYGGMRSVLAMNHFFLKWNKQRKDPDQTPTLIWASLRDELVHGPKLKLLAEIRAGWEFREASIAGSTLPKPYQHLIIDSAALGPAEWARVTRESLEFLVR